MTVEGARLRLRSYYIKASNKYRRKKIKNENFTIISNNCWGGTVYESYGLMKNSPTVGMYFAPSEYLKFVSNLEHYTSGDIEFIDPNLSRHKDLYSQDYSFGTYPIAIIDDVEIAFLHYSTEEEARDKWKRRCERINYDKLIIKMNDQNGCSLDDMRTFIGLDLNCKKIFFTTNKEWSKMSDEVYFVLFPWHTHVYASLEPFGGSRLCNINVLINSL